MVIIVIELSQTSESYPVSRKLTIRMLVVKKRSLVPNLIMCYSRDAQRDWIEYLRSREQKCEFLKCVYTTFFREWRNVGHVKYRYKVIGRLIFIEVLWESFHPNTPISGNLDFIYYHLPRSSSSLFTPFCHLISYLIRVHCNGIFFRLVSIYFMA